MNESLFKSTLRSLLSTLGKVFGIGLAIFLIALLFSNFSEESHSKLKITTNYKQMVAPNAKGIRKTMSDTTPVILQLNIQGIVGVEALTGDKIEELLTESRERDLADNRVKAILLNINSPGGTAYEADAIYHSIKRYKETYKVPVYAYVEGICASGGYYIACAADKIYMRDSAIVGSIGVLFSSPFFNVSQTMEKLGITAAPIAAGKGKDALNPFRSWTPDEQDNLRYMANGLYDDFVSIVVENRPAIDRDKLVNEYGANVFLAKQSLDYGFVDDAKASRSKVLNDLLEQLNIDDDDYQVVYLEKKSWLSEFLTEKNSPSFLSNHMHHHIDLGNGIPNELYGKPLYIYSPYN